MLLKIWLNEIKYHFDKQYEEDPNDYTIRNNIIIYRPNHGRAHSLRQAFITRDIILALSKYYTYDDNFIVKMMIMSSFQRSGRQSEGSSESLGQKYYDYEKKDVENAANFMKKSGIFNEEEIITYSNSIYWNNNNYIAKIIHAAHLFDLRRMVGFDKERIRKQISDILCPYVFDDIWNKVGKYLSVTGDRDMVTRKNYYSDKFYTQNIFSIYSALYNISI